MENKVIQDRLALLRAKMQEEGIDFYMMPTADFHNSEYVNDYFKVREYFSNFTGSNGTLLVWKDGAGLWTDGRYFIQAEAELEGTGVELFRMLQEGVPTIEEFLEQNMQQGQTLGFDGRVIAAMDGKKYEKVLAKTQIFIAYEKDLADSIWTDRPDFPAGKVTVLDEKIAGKSGRETHADQREDGKGLCQCTAFDQTGRSDVALQYPWLRCGMQPGGNVLCLYYGGYRHIVYPAEGTGYAGVRIPCSTSHQCEGIRHCRRLSEITSCRQCDPRG